jgi:hypothetical protein
MTKSTERPPTFRRFSLRGAMIAMHHYVLSIQALACSAHFSWFPRQLPPNFTEIAGQ